MKIKLPNPEDFQIKEVDVFGDAAYLIYPHAFPKWTEDNKYFRSSLWRKSDLQPISLSWRKFCYFTEQPDFEPLNLHLPIKYVYKVDGSTAIISKYNGKLIFRTRRTLDARNLKNGAEVDLLIKKYPKLFDNDVINYEDSTILCEWYSPDNIIILKEYAEPTLVLTGIIRHSDYTYWPQLILDDLAKDWGLERPKLYKFPDSENALKTVLGWVGKEGVVVYGNDDQVLKKIKSDDYNARHRLKAQINSLESLVDIYLTKVEGQLQAMDYDVFYALIGESVDFETITGLKDKVLEVAQAGFEIQKAEKGMNQFLNEIRNFPTRKDKALAILNQYKECGRSSYLFALLDRGKLGNALYKKLFMQILLAEKNKILDK